MSKYLNSLVVGIDVASELSFAVVNIDSPLKFSTPPTVLTT